MRWEGCCQQRVLHTVQKVRDSVPARSCHMMYLIVEENELTDDPGMLWRCIPRNRNATVSSRTVLRDLTLV